MIAAATSPGAAELLVVTADLKREVPRSNFFNRSLSLRFPHAALRARSQAAMTANSYLSEAFS
jgi:hypothetical protein